jgi:hypothetical protein
MPGQPWPVLGSTLATVLVAGAAGLATTVVVWQPSLRSRAPSSRSFAAGFGIAYAAVAVALWAVVRTVAHPVSLRGYGNALAGWVALAVLGAVVLGGGTAYVYDRFGYVSALLSLFAATAFTWYAFLLVGGETDVLWVWAFVFAPVLVAGAVALLAVEWVVQRLLGTGERGGGVA